MNSCNTENFREKEVINVCDGRRLGCVSEVIFDVCDGRITAIVVPAQGGFFGRKDSPPLIIPWERIEKIGTDVILANAEGCCPPPLAARGRRERQGTV